MEFVEAAQSAEHPMNEDPLGLVSDDILRSIFALLTSSPEEIWMGRRRALDELRAEAAALRGRRRSYTLPWRLACVR